MKDGVYPEVSRKATKPIEYHGMLLHYLYHPRVTCYVKGKKVWSEKAGNPCICRKDANEAAIRLLKDLFEQNKF
jgi:hypothetical protein